jgi:hypothetical protein
MITNTLIVPSAQGLLEANPELGNSRFINNINTYSSPIPLPQPAPRNR